MIASERLQPRPILEQQHVCVCTITSMISHSQQCAHAKPNLQFFFFLKQLSGMYGPPLFHVLYLQPFDLLIRRLFAVCPTNTNSCAVKHLVNKRRRLQVSV